MRPRPGRARARHLALEDRSRGSVRRASSCASRPPLCSGIDSSRPRHVESNGFPYIGLTHLTPPRMTATLASGHGVSQETCARHVRRCRRRRSACAHGHCIRTDRAALCCFRVPARRPVADGTAARGSGVARHREEGRLRRAHDADEGAGVAPSLQEAPHAETRVHERSRSGRDGNGEDRRGPAAPPRACHGLCRHDGCARRTDQDARQAGPRADSCLCSALGAGRAAVLRRRDRPGTHARRGPCRDRHGVGCRRSTRHEGGQGRRTPPRSSSRSP